MMLTRRSALGLASAMALVVATAAAAEPPAPFDAAAFDAAKAAGTPILVEISAPWCPICRAQKPILAKLRQDPRFKDWTVFEIDFDSRKDAVRHVGAQLQSTLIVFRHGREVARSVGESQAEWIEDLLEKAL